MSASIKNLYQFRTTSKITQAQGAASTFTVGNDIFTNSAVSITGWSIQLTNRTGSIVELFTVTVAAWVSTIASRGIKPDGTTDTIYQYERPRNTLCTVTVLENQITNKIDTNTFTQDQTVTSWKKLKLWASAYVWTENDGTDLKFKDGNNTEKTLTQLASLSGSNDKVKISATDTTEWFLNSKVTAGDWLSKTTINPAWNEVLDLDIDLTDTTIFATDGTASRAVVTDGSGNLFQATTTKRWGTEFATDAEVVTGADTTRTVSAEQLRKYSNTTAWNTSRLTSDSTWSQTVAHSLWVVPRLIEVFFVQRDTASSNASMGMWTYNWTSNQCIWYEDTWASSGMRLNTSNIIVFEDSSSVWRRATATFDSTNITLSRVKWWAWMNIDVIWKAYA